MAIAMAMAVPSRQSTLGKRGGNLVLGQQLHPMFVNTKKGNSISVILGWILVSDGANIDFHHLGGCLLRDIRNAYFFH